MVEAFVRQPPTDHHSLFRRCFDRVVISRFVRNGCFVDGRRYRVEALAEQGLDGSDVRRDDGVHEEIALAEKVALLRLDFAVFARLSSIGRW